MTSKDFRQIALSFPGAEESSHMGSPDFRVGGHIFATLASQKQGYGNLMLKPELQQAFLVKVFAGTASGATVAAYSVGQQIAIASFTLGIGFVALWTIFEFRSFKDVIAAGRADREGGGPPAADGATAAPAAPRAQA